MFTAKYKKNAQWIPYQRELIGLLITSAVTFLALSLYSYHPHDPSLFYISSMSRLVHNWCGIVGAQVAAILFFLFGGASFVTVFFGAYGLYVYAYDMPIADEWERLVAGIAVLPIGAMLASIHLTDVHASIVPGGYLGAMGAYMLLATFEYVGALLFCYTMLAAAFVLITRLSFVQVANKCVAGIVAFYRLMIKWQVAQRTWQGLVFTAWIISRPCVWLYQWACYFMEGHAFEDAGVTQPDDAHDPCHDFVTWAQEYQETTQKPDIQTGSNEPAFNQYMQNDPLDDVCANLNASEPKASDEPTETHADISSFSPEEMEQAPSEKAFAPTARTYQLPDLDVFVGVADEKNDPIVKRNIEKQAVILEEKLDRFGVRGKVTSIKRGPVVTLFEYEPDIDTKLSKILTLEDDLALALQAMSIRILAPIPGRSVVGFEVANKKRKDVLFSRVIKSDAFRSFDGILPLVLGEDTIGANMVVDLVRMPHLLIAGSTGSGKSVALNAMLMSLLCKMKPDELRLILIDPKRLEFAPYVDVAHLLFPIVTDPKSAAPILRWVVNEMESRYEKMATAGVRNVADYNQQIRGTQGEKLPYIVVVIDELADLMMTAGRDIEDLITRIAQMARAAGIHMIVATQRPSVDVITGLIKVNFPSRISFRVTSKVDSRTILDCVGADKLLGRGDMLFLDSTASTLKRIHGAYVSDFEIEQVVGHIRAEQPSAYLELPFDGSKDTGGLLEADDELYKNVLIFIESVDEISISLLQRKFRIGYNRSARVMDMLESQGYILPADGSKTRKVIRQS